MIGINYANCFSSTQVQLTLSLLGLVQWDLAGCYPTAAENLCSTGADDAGMQKNFLQQ